MLIFRLLRRVRFFKPCHYTCFLLDDFNSASGSKISVVLPGIKQGLSSSTLHNRIRCEAAHKVNHASQGLPHQFDAHIPAANPTCAQHAAALAISKPPEGNPVSHL